jgi:hypothetical protein
MLTIAYSATGHSITTKIFGSSKNDDGLDMVVNHFGIFVMANIGNGFKDKDFADSFST